MGHSKDSKKSPYVSSNYSSLEFEISRGLKPRKTRSLGYMPIMKNMDFVIETLYEVETEPGAPSSSSVPI
jgi:hypothetical protein